MSQVNNFRHGTIMRTGITCKEILYKSLLNSAWLSRRAQLAINKEQKYCSISDYQLAENLILFLVSKKGQKEIKIEFATKSVGNIVTIIFM